MNHKQLKELMVDTQIVSKGIRNRRVLQAVLFIYSVFHSQQIKLALNENHYVTGNKCDLLVAFSVLFSEGIKKNDTYYIPDLLLSKYTDLLGVNIEKGLYITNTIINSSNHFENNKAIIFNKLKKNLKKKELFDSLAFLEYINSLKKGEDSPIIVKNEYSIVPWNRTLEAKKNTKRIYSFGQDGCDVVFCSFNNETFFMTHYPGSLLKKEYPENYLKNVNKRFAVMGKQSNLIMFYVIAHFPYMICHVLNDIFNDYPQKKIFYHAKDPSMIYAIKASIEKNQKLTCFRLPAFIKSVSTGLYKTGAYMVPFGPFEKIPFGKFD